jgi:hypothetical protein
MPISRKAPQSVGPRGKEPGTHCASSSCIINTRGGSSLLWPCSLWLWPGFLCSPAICTLRAPSCFYIASITYGFSKLPPLLLVNVLVFQHPTYILPSSSNLLEPSHLSVPLPIPYFSSQTKLFGEYLFCSKHCSTHCDIIVTPTVNKTNFKGQPS